MKKILSLILVISMCLSAVILLASCAGKSAYEVAVEGGFTGTEQEWLASLKGEPGENGKDGEKGDDGELGYPGLPGESGLDPYEHVKFYDNYMKTVTEWLAALKGEDGENGHTPSVSVDNDGYWVIDGTKQPVKVDGNEESVDSVELVNNVFTVVKGDNVAPTMEIKVKLANGEEWILPVSNSVISEKTYDLTKEGTYPVTIKYGGLEVAAEIVVDGLMIYYENFDSLTNGSKMAEILEQSGIRIPTVGSTNTYATGTLKDTGEEVLVYGHKSWWDDGSDITPYILFGKYHGAIYPALSIENGRLFYFVHRTNEVFSNAASDSMIIIKTDEEMNYAATDTYTLQMDFQMFPGTDGKKGTVSVSGNVVFVCKFADEGIAGNKKGHNRPVSIGACFNNEYLMANVYRKSSWYLGNGGAVSAEGLESHGDQSLKLLDALFPDSTTGTWLGENVTVRIVVRAKNSNNPGYTVYIKKATDGEDKFQLVGEFNASTTTTTGMTWFLRDDNDGFAIVTRSAAYTSGFYVDNIAAWTGDGNMPTNTNTSTYEALNDAYNK